MKIYDRTSILLIEFIVRNFSVRKLFILLFSNWMCIVQVHTHRRRITSTAIIHAANTSKQKTNENIEETRSLVAFAALHKYILYRYCWCGRGRSRGIMGNFFAVYIYFFCGNSGARMRSK